MEHRAIGAMEGFGGKVRRMFRPQTECRSLGNQALGILGSHKSTTGLGNRALRRVGLQADLCDLAVVMGSRKKGFAPLCEEKLQDDISVGGIGEMRVPFPVAHIGIDLDIAADLGAAVEANDRALEIGSRLAVPIPEVPDHHPPAAKRRPLAAETAIEQPRLDFQLPRQAHRGILGNGAPQARSRVGGTVGQFHKSGYGKFGISSGIAGTTVAGFTSGESFDSVSNSPGTGWTPPVSGSAGSGAASTTRMG